MFIVDELKYFFYSHRSFFNDLAFVKVNRDLFDVFIPAEIALLTNFKALVDFNDRILID